MSSRFNMHLKHSIALPGVPAEGEIGRVIVSGAPRQSGRHHGRQDDLHRQRRRFPVAVSPTARGRVHRDLRISQAATERITVRHPGTPGFNRIESPIFVSGRGTAMRNAAIGFPALQSARRAAPGTAARLAVMRGRGRPGVDAEVPAPAIIAAQSIARIAGAATAGNRKAVRPSVSGRARICARHAPGVDPADPFPLRSRLQAPGAQGRPDHEAAPNSTTARNPSGGRERSATSRTRIR